jgi:hypothetical protein
MGGYLKRSAKRSAARKKKNHPGFDLPKANFCLIKDLRSETLLLS